MTAKEQLHLAVDGFSETEAAELLSLLDGYRSLSGEAMTRVLDGIDGAHARALRGSEQARAGETVTLDELERGTR